MIKEYININSLINGMRLLQGVVVVVLGILFISVSTMALVELSSRISAKSFVSKKIDALEKQVVLEGIHNAVNETNRASIESDVSNYQAIMDDLEHLSLTGASSPEETVYAIRHRLAEHSRSKSVSLQIETLNKKLSSLEEGLSDSESDRNMLRSQVQKIQTEMEKELSGEGTGKKGAGPVYSSLEKQYEQAKGELLSIEDNIDSTKNAMYKVRDQLDNLRKKGLTWEPDTYVSVNKLIYMPTEMLLAIVIVLCGGTGSILTSLRSQSEKHLSAVFIGLLAGFVAFLIVKGGKFVFIINISPESSVFINPFAAAFAGILAGLFTEKAYQILSGLADQIGNKILGKENP